MIISIIVIIIISSSSSGSSSSSSSTFAIAVAAVAMEQDIAPIFWARKSQVGLEASLISSETDHHD